MNAVPQQTAKLTVSESDIRQYEQDGAICLRGVISQEWIERMRVATDRLLAGDMQDMSQKGRRGRFVGDVNMWQKDPEFRAYVFESPYWQIAQSLMRSSAVRVFTDQLFVKAPGTESPTPWHQDQTYWPVLGDHVCSIWVTLDPVTRATSGLEYIKGSHRWGKRFDPVDFGDHMSLEFLRDAANDKLPDIEANRDQYEFLSWDMLPGDCLVHHSLTVHGAGANRSSTQWRRAISTRWFGDQAYFRPHAMFTSEVVGLPAGAPLTSPMFPRVPLDPNAPLQSKPMLPRR